MKKTILLLTSVLLSTSALHAANYYWRGGVDDDDMESAQNWTPNGVPQNNNYSDVIYFNEDATTKMPVKTFSGTRRYAGIQFDESFGWEIQGSGSYEIGSRLKSTGVGTNTINPRVVSFAVGQWDVGADNVLVLAGGVGWDSNSSQVTVNGPGTLLVTAGASGYNTAKPAIIKGNLILSGALNNTANYWVCTTGSLATAANGSFANELTLDQEGCVIVNGQTNGVGKVFLGAPANASVGGREGGVIDLGTGALSVNMLTIKGGTITAQSQGQLRINTGAYQLPNSVLFLASEQPGAINANVLLQAAATDCILISSNQTAAINGSISEATGVATKGITKLGSGILAINGDTYFSRDINVRDGRLIINGTDYGKAASYSINTTNAVFGGAYTTARKLNVRANAALSPGYNGAGTLWVSNNVEFAANTAINYTVTTAAPLLKISKGTLTINAPVNIAVMLERGFTPAVYPIIDATGSTGDFDLSNFNLTVSGTGRASLSMTGRIVRLAVSNPATLLFLK